MKITIKQVQGVLISNLLVIGLVSCSSTPSPWSQSDSSPWKAKRDADAASVTAEEFVAVPVEEEPVMVDPVPVIEEPVYVQEPEPIPEPEPVVEEVVPMGIMAMPASSFAVQVYAGKTVDSVERYQRAHGLENLMIVKTMRDGTVYHVLVDVYDNREVANNAAADLQQRTGSKPWVRSIAGLQKIVAE